MTMMTTDAPVGGVADPREALDRMLGATVSAPAPGAPDFGDPALLTLEPRATACVLRQCSEESLRAVYAATGYDALGNAQTARMLRHFEQVTMPGDNMLGFKRGDGQVVSELVGVPVRVSPYREYWGGRSALNPEKPVPTCGSLDMAIGQGDPGGDCNGCPAADFRKPRPRCASKSRLYLASGTGDTLTCVRLTAMPRQGLLAADKWARAAGRHLTDFVWKFWIELHPREMKDASYPPKIVRCRPLYLANDGSDAYEDALELVDGALALAEAAWLVDLARRGQYDAPVSTRRSYPALQTTARTEKRLASSPVEPESICPECGVELYAGELCMRCQPLPAGPAPAAAAPYCERVDGDCRARPQCDSGGCVLDRIPAGVSTEPANVDVDDLLPF